MRGEPFRCTKFDEFVKSRHSGEPRIRSGAGTGVQVFSKSINKLDSGFRRNDAKRVFWTSYESVKLELWILAFGLLDLSLPSAALHRAEGFSIATGK